MKLLVTGGRDFNDVEYIVSKLSEFHSICPISKVVAGGARGVDTIAVEWAALMDIPFIVYEAQWSTLGRKAGPLRNIEMLEKERPDLVMAFPGGVGTSHMVDISHRAKVEVIQYLKISFRKEDPDYGFMSNFYPYSIVDYDGLYWPSTEHYYAAHKTLDHTAWIAFQKEEDPAKVKKMGRALAIRPDWLSVREDVMREALGLKFAPGTTMAQLLLDTGEHYLHERAPWDDYWGGGKDGQGQNRLGWLLMERRDELRIDKAPTRWIDPVLSRMEGGLQGSPLHDLFA